MLIRADATDYRRWSNQPWAVVEAGGAAAGDWTRADRGVSRAGARGTASGSGSASTRSTGTSERCGWTEGYNFGTLEAVRLRWRAAIEAGVDFIATDQDEVFSDTRAAAAR